MEDLPMLALKNVFDYLPNLNEQIRCSSTCKNWRAAFQEFRPGSLKTIFECFAIVEKLDVANLHLGLLGGSSEEEVVQAVGK